MVPEHSNTDGLRTFEDLEMTAQRNRRTYAGMIVCPGKTVRREAVRGRGVTGRIASALLSARAFGSRVESGERG